MIKYWTKQEELDLQHSIRIHMSMEEIAKKHERSVRAIQLRFAMILQKRMESGEKISTLEKDYNIDKKLVEFYIEQLKNSQKESSGQDNKVSSLEKKIKILEERIEKLEKNFSKLYKKFKKGE